MPYALGPMHADRSHQNRDSCSEHHRSLVELTEVSLKTNKKKIQKNPQIITHVIRCIRKSVVKVAIGDLFHD